MKTQFRIQLSKILLVQIMMKIRILKITLKYQIKNKQLSNIIKVFILVIFKVQYKIDHHQDLIQAKIVLLNKIDLSFHNLI